MRIPLFCAIWLVGIASAQPADPDHVLKLRGDRVPPIKYQDMTPAQKAMADRAMAGRGAIGDFNIVLRSPELAAVLRSGPRTAISTKQSELAILISARYWTTQFEWAVHHRAAVQAGLSEAIVSAIAEGRKPESLAPDEAAVYNFLEELFNTKQVSDATFAATKSALGDQGIMELFGVVGFYQSVSLMMNADRYPMNPGQMAELKPLPQSAGASPVSATGRRTLPAARSRTDDAGAEGPDG